MVVETSMGGEAREFPATRWTLISSSKSDPDARRDAIEFLFAAYWKPLYHYARRKGHSIEASKDIVQGFFVHLLEREFLDRLDPARGRFRAWLRTSLDHYLVNLHEHDSALKRGGAVKTLSLDFERAERGLDAAAAEDPIPAFDREWALGLMERSLAALRREGSTGGSPARLEAALRFFGPGDPPTYETAAAEAGMTATQFKAFLHRVRARFRRIVQDEIAQTVSGVGEQEAEMAELMRALK